MLTSGKLLSVLLFGLINAEINKGSEKVKISPVISASLITEFVDGIYKCELITNNKEKCVFFDLNNEEIEREEATVKCPAIGFTRGNGCTLHLSDRSIASTGTWRVYTYFNNSNGADRWVNEYEVFMEENHEKTEQYSETADNLMFVDEMEEDQTVHTGEEYAIWIGSAECKLSCEFIDPNGIKHSNLGGKLKCVLKKIFDESEAGKWTANCNNIEDKAKPIVYKFNLIVETGDDSIIQTGDQVVYTGLEVGITTGNAECKSCEFIDPNGKKYWNSEFLPCTLLKVFDKSEAGEWTANCNNEKKSKPTVYKFNLIVKSKTDETGEIDKGTKRVRVDPNFAYVSLTTDHTDGIYKCEFTSNKNEKCTFFHIDKEIAKKEKLKCPKIEFNKGYYCTLHLGDKSVASTGIWRVLTYYNNTKEINNWINKFDVYLEKNRVATEPHVEDGGHLIVYSGNYLQLRLKNNYPGITSCQLQIAKDDKLKFELLGKKVDGLEANGQCGFRMKANDTSRGGEYKLSARVGPNVIYNGMVDVKIVRSNGAGSNNNELEDKIVRFGEKFTVWSGNENCKSCEFIDPLGNKYQNYKNMPCALVKLFKRSEAGEWTTLCNVEGNTKPLVFKFNLIVEVVRNDKIKIIKSIERVASGKINLLCILPQMKYVRPGDPDVCQFVRPDGQQLNMYKGVDDNSYSYHHSDNNSEPRYAEKYTDCGLTIIQPKDVDFGTWQCKVSQANSQVHSEFLDLTDSTINSNVIFVQDVYVKRDDSFQIRCLTYNTGLDYCWFKAPNGTAFKVAEAVKDDSTLEYEGKGYSSGECVVKVPSATDTDSGDWKCHLGLASGLELDKLFKVQVSDGYLDVTESVVRARLSGMTIITSQVIPGYESIIDYCRWIRPDGEGIFRSSATGNYVNKENSTHCQLLIKSISSVDLGEWTSVAKIHGQGEGENVVKINVVWQLTYLRDLDSDFAYLLTLLVMTVLFTLLTMTLIRKRILIRQKFSDYYGKIVRKH